MCRRMINLERPCNALSLDVIVEHYIIWMVIVYSRKMLILYVCVHVQIENIVYNVTNDQLFKEFFKHTLLNVLNVIIA